MGSRWTAAGVCRRAAVGGDDPWAVAASGAFTRFALIAGGIVVLCLVIGTNLAQDWLVSGLQLIYAFLYYYLLAHIEENGISIDAMMKSK